jgi:hypothetical protein
MSPAVPISFLITLLCVLIAIDWPVLQQFMLVGATAGATVFFCYIEGLELKDRPVRSDDGAETRE